MLLYIRGSHSTSLGIICPRSLQHQDPIGPAQEARPGQRGVINRSNDHCQNTVPRRPDIKLARGHWAEASGPRNLPPWRLQDADRRVQTSGWLAQSCRARAPPPVATILAGPPRVWGSRIFPRLLASEIDHFADKPSTCWWYSFSWIRTQENKFVANSGAPLYCNGLDGDHIETMPKKEQSVVLVKKWLLLTLPS
jgi:hypothetical protein